MSIPTDMYAEVSHDPWSDSWLLAEAEVESTLPGCKS